MKKLIYIMLAAMVLTNTACEKDFLEVEAPSSVDEDFVFGSPSEAFKVLAGMYDYWHDLDRLMYYETEVVGSDSERHPENYSSQGRHIPEGLFASEYTIHAGESVTEWNECYLIINRVNIMLEALEGKQEYQDAVKAGKPSAWTQLYGEAVAFRATCYKLLIRYFGDVPYFDYPIRNTAQTDTLGLTSRDVIYDKEIAALKAATPLMYRLGDGGLTAERFSGTYADAVIGRMAFDAAGYQLRRTNFDYGNVAFDQIGVENATWQAKYVRRTDWMDYMQIAKEHYLKVVNNPGSAILLESDERGAGFNNPFQRNFQYLMDLEISPESIFEAGYTRGQNSDFPYSFGRPSGGGSRNAYPCKNYGQSRVYASFYYGDFMPNDMRRDVTACVTANSGAASEILINFQPGSREKGGLANNKLDESRFADPYTARQRQSGCNWQQLRMADVMLDLAYASAATGDEGTAKTYLTKVRSRAFSSADQATYVTGYVNALSGQDLLDAIAQERKLELAAEGKTRWDMTLYGTMPERIKKLRDTQIAMVEGLKSDGYYTFAETGMTISNWVWTKYVNIKEDIDPSLNLLTTQAPDGITTADPTYPVLVPGWRGTSDLWTDYISTLASDKVNLAIRGLYEYIDPDGPVALALEADGYEKQPWGQNIIDNESQYTSDIFKGYPDSYYSAGEPPRYIRAIPYETLVSSNGNITQGYGHASE
ncbi:RagB/SusD family nutrient uptake outer membrane protein [Aestuariibaculum sp. YM273]|uniref:RagB/SusD family nutrient uptake outer membrane protein n=1 Tax=Aestuariibaculum sp. YM273 TaxID=3070659 RepID=UPI0027DE0CF6|nr:RagB/SusD family nutrient uptake outer membrane protein [Aestuariibaculum sp. YM273]WMI66300.1 RagB/SusD family nutrient uptake outer membrane protein [Aestuariibaculum sp. YM273]